MNIARGRDHGLADFVTICTALGFAACDMPDRVREVYGDATVDAIVGFLGEGRSAGGYLGPVTLAVAALQFALIRDDDPNFYDSEGMFDAATLDWIRGRSLSDIIADNTWVSHAQLPHDIFRAGRIGPIASTGDITPIPLPAGSRWRWPASDSSFLRSGGGEAEARVGGIPAPPAPTMRSSSRCRPWRRAWGW